jgi:hypothetical protein
MFHLFEPSGSVAGLRQLVRDALARGCRGLQILGTVENGWTNDDVAAVGAFAGVPVFGGLFPRVVHDGHAGPRGTVVIGHDERPTVRLMRQSDAIGPAGMSWPSALAEAGTIIAYVDATCDTTRLTTMLFEEIGAGPTFIGGGAGALDFVRRPVIISSEGLHEGAAILAAFKARASVAVTHGWRPVGERMVVTGAQGGTVVTLDWRPAFEVWREAVERSSGERVPPERFGAVAPSWPFVLERIGAESVVRDPLVLGRDGSLHCAGGVQAHTVVRIATSSPDDMVAAAREARELALGRAPAPPELALTIDCISRALLLGDELSRELAALKVPGVPQVGALTLGELANDGEDLLEIHNKTTVLALLRESGDDP